MERYLKTSENETLLSISIIDERTFIVNGYRVRENVHKESPFGHRTKIRVHSVFINKMYALICRVRHIGIEYVAASFI